MDGEKNDRTAARTSYPSASNDEREKLSCRFSLMIIHMKEYWLPDKLTNARVSFLYFLSHSHASPSEQ